MRCLLQPAAKSFYLRSSNTFGGALTGRILWIPQTSTNVIMWRKNISLSLSDMLLSLLSEASLVKIKIFAVVEIYGFLMTQYKQIIGEDESAEETKLLRHRRRTG